jgi:protein-S-isoprenylcysteine O-methyltransferase Ste14
MLGEEQVPMRVALLLAAAVLFAVGVGSVIVLGTKESALLCGGVLVLVGLPLVVLARLQLGSAFAFTPQAKGLVTRGLYSRIPHPMYVFLDLALLGGITLLRQLWLLVPWVGLIAVQVLQARRETAILERAFGDAYRDYRKRTWW